MQGAKQFVWRMLMLGGYVTDVVPEPTAGATWFVDITARGHDLIVDMKFCAGNPNKKDY
jgi:hypothetical protein